jgi:predicted acyl esterase
MVSLGDNGTSSWQVEASMPPVSAHIRAGHRLRLQISSGAFPRFVPHPGTGEPIATVATRLPSRQTIHHSDTHPATVHVPVVAPSA